MALSKILPASQEQYVGSRNLIINGNMAVAQRGTSHSYAHDGERNAYNLDRFKLQMRSVSDEFDATVAQVSDSPDGFSNSLKMTTGTPESTVNDDDFFLIEHRIEAQNLQHLAYGTSSAEATTLSFYVKSSVTGTFGCSFYQPDSVRTISKTYTINSANTWERKIITVAGDTSGVIDNNNETGLFIYWNLGSGVNYDSAANTTWAAYTTTNFFDSSSSDALVTTAGATWQITGCQLEVGSATPFEHESYAASLQKCQRYFYRIGGDAETAATGTDVGRLASGVMTSTTASVLMRPNPVIMRDAPNLTFDDAVANYTLMTSRTTNAVTAVGANSSTASTIAFGLTSGAASIDGDGALLRSTRAQSTISIDAEL
jgi:hypothetical protein